MGSRPSSTLEPRLPGPKEMPGGRKGLGFRALGFGFRVEGFFGSLLDTILRFCHKKTLRGIKQKYIFNMTPTGNQC